MKEGTAPLIYLDYAATTPCDTDVVAAMEPFLTQYFGNPSSPHRYGAYAAEMVERARREILRWVSEGEGHLVFTSGATESNNIAVASLIWWTREVARRSRVLCCVTEHKSVLAPLTEWGRRLGVQTDWIPVRPSGELDWGRFEAQLDERVGGVIVQLANSETGVVQDLGRVTDLAHAVGARVFSDVTQALGRIAVPLKGWHVDWAAFSAHKIYGPKGVGALYVGPEVTVLPLTRGGGQERDWRPGTENVPGIMGFASAVRLAYHVLDHEPHRLARLRDALWERLSRLDGITWNGREAPALLPSHLNLTVDGVVAQELLLRVPQVAFSAGSACNARTHQPSPVLQHMGRTVTQAEQTIRLTVGRPTTVEEVERAAEALIAGIGAIRSECGPDRYARMWPTAGSP